MYCTTLSAQSTNDRPVDSIKPMNRGGSPRATETQGLTPGVSIAMPRARCVR
jgi:hypothetical protein